MSINHYIRSKFLYILILINLLSIESKGQIELSQLNSNHELIRAINREIWVDSVLKTMTMDEKIGQLFIIRAHSDKNREYHLQIKSQIEKYKVGGLCFFQGSPTKQIALINEYNAAANFPLFVAIDGEWGVGMRIDSALNFPKQMTLGATNDSALVYKIGRSIGQQCKSVGINLNFAPVVDVNSNPLNPVINSRSFGENPLKTSILAWQIAKGLQDEGVMACAKHFPGHGDTYSDSHKTLPTIESNFSAIDSIHLFPFKYLATKGIKSVMIGHLFVPAIDTTNGQASSLSPLIVKDLLFNKIGFNGLAITDALEMKGVSSYYKPGEIELKALLAGNDILLMPNDIDTSISVIKAALDSGIIDSCFIDFKVEKILRNKYDLGLITKNTVNENNYKKLLTNDLDANLINEAYKKSLTLIKNNNNQIPIATNQHDTIVVISIGADAENIFSNTVENHNNILKFSLSKYANRTEESNLIEIAKKYPLTIVNLLGTNMLASKSYGITKSSVEFIKKLSINTSVILVISGNPYSASQFIDSEDIKTILIAYEDNSTTRRIAADAIFGAQNISGKLPVTITKNYPSGFGLETSRTTIGYASAEELGYKSSNFGGIDSIINDGISHGAYPGARVLIAKDGYIFYDKAFGYTTYENIIPVEKSTVYDLASLTKVLATTLSIMRLQDEGLIDIDKKIGDYLPELEGSNKEKIHIKDILSHQAKLEPWIPFYTRIIKNGLLDSNIISPIKKPGFSKRLSTSYYISDSYHDTMLMIINNSRLASKKEYKYSDLGMYYLQEIIEKVSGTTLDNYCDSVFYQPLGLKLTGYNPSEHIDLSRIAPTEMDMTFRKELVHGFVHDQGAAMAGGVAGHAGLFSTADEIAIICQMLLQHGKYGNREFIEFETLEEFTKRYSPSSDNRRALGFDKPLPNHKAGGPTCTSASAFSYGHSGFTGTYFWVDPQYNLIYIFLSNRVYPSAENKKLLNMDIRVKIQDEIYKQLGLKE